MQPFRFNFPSNSNVSVVGGAAIQLEVCLRVAGSNPEVTERVRWALTLCSQLATGRAILEEFPYIPLDDLPPIRLRLATYKEISVLFFEEEGSKVVIFISGLTRTRCQTQQFII
jgi:hypothetical protein